MHRQTSNLTHGQPSELLPGMSLAYQQSKKQLVLRMWLLLLWAVLSFATRGCGLEIPTVQTVTPPWGSRAGGTEIQILGSAFARNGADGMYVWM